MSGHSKWATTKHRKGAQDAKRSALFSSSAATSPLLPVSAVTRCPEQRQPRRCRCQGQGSVHA